MVFSTIGAEWWILYALLFILIVFSLVLVSIVCRIKRWFALLFDEFDKFRANVKEVRNTLEEVKAKVALHDDVMEIQEILEEMNSDRSLLPEGDRER
jgi:hypothetical protein